ncbi:uncharacterized protein PHALS_14825 [Plasmopara halstedii]|uniref:Uncharacterized protein n=1 Tax=Plasmopara halstedii TaxID=4781 RepID=A0A0N7L6Y8_PLAHL|nr:uncharacterized protein PHALS_14825 [Plasmopara halstedii]CEG45595.1 hypothetical protein PHALS_14825 [Plasmopara halstedii]|eukprot:XP_024581964.1 hypothetical protein PHALS_14825 [Plasmopara halstedii]
MHNVQVLTTGSNTKLHVRTASKAAVAHLALVLSAFTNEVHRLSLGHQPFKYQVLYTFPAL